MADVGVSPIGLYNLVTLPVGQEWVMPFPSINNITVLPFLLSHGKKPDGSTYFSTAFLLQVGLMLL